MPTTMATTDRGRTIAGMDEAFGRGDVPSVLAQLAPELDWIETEAQAIPTRGRFSSPDEVLHGVFAKVGEHFESFALQPELWIEAGDDVVVTGRVVARTKSGRDLDAPYAHVFSFRGDQVCRNDNFHDTALGVDALA